MLKPYRYISLDFETTGLDPEKDDPIQVGLVVFDEHFEIIETFTSLIRPEKKRNELRSIVTYLTGFTIDDLETAPPLEQVKQQLAPFFDEPFVLIGQNVGFDLAVLHQFLPVTPTAQIDTYHLAKAVLHFAPSYALDVTAELISVSYDLPDHDAGYHDALTDSFAAYKVCRYFIERLTELRHNYLILDYLLENSTGDIATIIKRTDKNFSFSNKKLFLPPLKKEVKRQARRVDTSPLDLDYPTHTVLDARKTSLRQLLTKLDFEQGDLILSFQTRAKMAHAGNILKELQIQHTTLHDRAVFDPERVDAFLHQESFTDPELLFVTKYVSQHQQNYGIFDANSTTDWTIFSALTTSQASASKLPIITTHNKLRTNQHKLTNDQHILFFDHARRYQSFRKRKYRPVDPLHGIYLLERLKYLHQLASKQPLIDALNKLEKQYTVFIGVLGTETDKFFVGYPDRKQEIEYVLDNPRYPRTTKLFFQLKAAVEQLTDHLPADDVLKITELIDQLQEVLGGLCTVEKRMYDGDKWRYRFHQVDQFVDYSEFLAMAQPGTWHFISNFEKQEDPKKVQLPASDTQQLPVIIERNAKKLIKRIKKRKNNWYIVSTAKHISKELFQEMVDHELQATHTILAENITGGAGKNCFMAQQSSKPLVLIGGYRFYFEVLAKKIALSGLYLYHLYGPMKQQMVADMQRYARG